MGTWNSCIGDSKCAYRIRYFFVGVVAIILAFGLSSTALVCGAEVPDATESLTLKINGIDAAFSDEITYKGGTILAPARDIFEALGGEVAWVPTRKEISVIKNGNELSLWIGSKTAFYNSKFITLPESITLVRGKTLVPLRAVAEAMGANVVFDSDLGEINIKVGNSALTSGEAISAIPSPISKGVEEKRGTFLTYEEAAKFACKASSSYNAAKISAEKAKEKNNNLQMSSGIYDLSILQAKKGLTLEETWAVMNLAIMEEQITMDIRSKMDALTLKEKELALLEEKNAITREKARIAELKYECGQLSKVALNDARTERDLGIQSADVMEKEINTAYTELNTALGKPLDDRPSFEYKVTCGAIGKVDLDSKIRQDKAADPYLWLSRQQKDLAEFNLNTYEYNRGDSSWTLTKLDLSQARLNLATSEDNFGKTVQSRYNQLLIMEANLKSLDLSLEQAKNAFYQARVKYDLGYMVKVDLEDARRGVRDAELKREKLFQQYRDVMLTFDKPYLSPVYISSK